MRSYYHNFPICPSCHEPLVNGYPLVAEDYSAKCTSPDCGASFLRFVDLQDIDLSAYLREQRVKRPGEDSRIQGCEFYWRVVPNCIEKSYIDWIKTTDGGNFLVTWPWSRVRFAGLLAAEWVMDKPLGKAVVIGPLSAYGMKRDVFHPGANETLEYLRCINELPRIETAESQNLSKVLKGILKNTLQLRTVAVVLRKKVMSRGVASQEVFPETAKECARRILEQQRDVIKELFVDGRAVYSNPEGSHEVSVTSRIQRMGRLAYRRDWLIDILMNSDRPQAISKLLKPTCISNLEELTNADPNGRLFFIAEPSKTLPTSEVLRFTKRVGANLVIIQNADHFIKDNYLTSPGDRSSELMKYLQSNETSCTLMFSPNPDFRSYYRMKWPRSNFVRDSKTTVHTWDTQTVLEQISESEWSSQSEYPNPIFSTSRELREPVHTLPADYHAVVDLDTLEGILDPVMKSIPGENSQKLVREYFGYVVRSPLLLQGDYNEDEEILSRRGCQGVSLTYDQICNILFQQSSGNNLAALDSFLAEKYGVGTNRQTNPLLEEIDIRMQEILKEGTGFITVVVHGLDVKGTQSLLKKRGFEDHMGARISVVKWDNLQIRQRDVGRRTRHTVICTLAPVQTFPILEGVKNAYVFLGSSESNRVSKTRIEKRLIEENSRPYQLLGDSDLAPHLLHEIQRRVGLRSEDYRGFSSDYSEETILKLNWSAIDGRAGMNGPVTESLPAGSRAILAGDAEGGGILLPLSASPLARVGQNLEIIHLSESDSPEGLTTALKDKELLVDRRGLSAVFQPIFLKGVLRLGHKITIDTGLFKWRGMKELYEDAIRWNIILESAASQIASQKGIPQSEADVELSLILVQSDLSAKDPDYIVSWWRNYTPVEVEDNSFYKLYAVGHPRTLSDMKKIFNTSMTIVNARTSDEGADAEKCWAASNIFQNIRDAVLKEKEDIADSLRVLVPPIKEELRDSLNQLTFLEVTSVEMVAINVGVNAYEVFTREQIRSMISGDVITLL